MPEFQNAKEHRRAWLRWRVLPSALKTFFQESVPHALALHRSKLVIRVVSRQSTVVTPDPPAERGGLDPASDPPQTDIAQEQPGDQEAPQEHQEPLSSSVLTEDTQEPVTLAEEPRESVPQPDEGQQAPPPSPEPPEKPDEQRQYPSLYDRSLDPPDYAQEEELHPHIKSHPARDQLATGLLAYGWRIAGASHRGFGHAYDGDYREDDFAICYISDDTPEHEDEIVAVLVAIADGVGSKTYARYGALAAVEGAISNFSHQPWRNAVCTLAAGLREDLRHEMVLDTDQPDAASRPEAEQQRQASPSVQDERASLACILLSQAMEDALVNVMTVAQEKQLPPSDLHSTLLVFLAIPLQQDCLFVASTQVGDGALFLRQEEQGETYRNYWQGLQGAQIHETGNEVLPLLSSDRQIWAHFFRCGVYKNALFLMGMTDGTANDIEPPFPTLQMPDPDPYIFVESFYSYIKRALYPSSNQDVGSALGNALEYRKTRSYDDRTLICIYYDQREDRQP